MYGAPENPWEKPRGSLHFVGIAGAGMSALAWAALDRGIPVTGSDLAGARQLERLRSAGADVRSGHGGPLPADTAAVLYSSAVAAANPELREAARRGIPVLHRSELLALMFETKRGLAVAGSHGKTGVSALLAWILIRSGLDPAYAVGGRILGLERNGGWGEGKFLVAEADESDGSFRRFAPAHALITGVELDHVDRYPDLDSLRGAFTEFARKIAPGGVLFYPDTEPWLEEVATRGVRLVAFGEGPGNGYRLREVRQEGREVSFRLDTPGGNSVLLKIPGFGRIAALNALPAAAAALENSVSAENVRAALASFPGVARRMEAKPGTGDILLIEDYAHHPTEIRAAVAAARAAAPGRLVGVFEPHRYSRLKRFRGELAEALLGLDEIFVTDLYGAFEPVLEGIDGRILEAEIAARGAKARGPFPIPEIPALLAAFLRPGDTALLMGAGRITEAASSLQALLAEGSAAFITPRR